MNRIDNSGQGLAQLGRDEDQYMAHVAQGEMVVPPIISPETRERIEAEMRAAGLSPDEYTVGDGMSINPITGMPEFGWLKKTFKSVKKVVKKAAPVIGVASMFIPGLGPAISGALKAIPGVGGALSSGFNFITGAGAGGAAGAAGGASGAASGGGLLSRIKGGIGSFFNPAKGAKGIFGGSFGPNLRGGIGGLFGGGAGAAGGGTGGGGLFSKIRGFFNPAEGATGIFGGNIGPNLRRGIGGLFGGGMQNIPGMPGSMPTGMPGGQQGGFYNASYTPSAAEIDELFTSGKLKYVEGYDGMPGHLEAPDGTKFNSVDEYFASQQAQQSPGGLAGFFGNFLGGKSPIQFLSSKFLPQSIEDALGTGPGGGGPFGGGGQGGGGLGGMLGGNMGAAGIAALLGKTVYDAAKERQGGLAATPAVTMDALGRYSLANALGTGGTREEFGLGPAPSSLKFNMGGPVNRQYFNQGGLAVVEELDMRDGGESAGPGTGTSDDIPAMLSDGEFVMTAKATRGAGAFDLNKTKSGIELIQGGDPSREKGVENMRELMNIFEAI